MNDLQEIKFYLETQCQSGVISPKNVARAFESIILIMKFNSKLGAPEVSVTDPDTVECEWRTVSCDIRLVVFRDGAQDLYRISTYRHANPQPSSMIACSVDTIECQSLPPALQALREDGIL